MIDIGTVRVGKIDGARNKINFLVKYQLHAPNVLSNLGLRNLQVSQDLSASSRTSLA